jgi:hypothetical protein
MAGPKLTRLKNQEFSVLSVLKQVNATHAIQNNRRAKKLRGIAGPKLIYTKHQTISVPSPDRSRSSVDSASIGAAAGKPKLTGATHQKFSVPSVLLQFYRTKNIKLPEMKKLFITLIVLIPFTLLAQPGERLLSDEKREEIESMKVGYLTSKMNLTGEEAQVFWPVYNEYRAEADAHREEGIKKLKEYRENRSDLSEAEVKAYLSSKFEHERAAIAIEEKYFNRFLEVLPAEKVARLMEAEEGFKRELLQRVMQERQRARERKR